MNDTNSYKLRLIHTVADGEGYFSILWKDFDLPFVPWIGLEVADWDAGFNARGLVVTNMLWSATLRAFVAQTAGEKWGRKENAASVAAECDAAREERIRQLIKDGWSDEDLDE